MQLDVNELSSKQIFMLSGEDLKSLVLMIVEKYSKKEPSTMPVSIPARLARKMLKEKGYKVRSDASFISFVKTHNLTRNFKGREYWYQTAEIDAFPSLVPTSKSKSNQ